jgi:ferredoxin/flavodoxin---NADP+ reductase
VYKIVEKQQLSQDVCLFKIDAPKIAKKRHPGQFIIFRIDEVGERVPITIADSDTEKGTITIIVQGVGKTTKKLNALPVGFELADVVGPLGRPTEIEKIGHVVAVGGGVGTAIALPVAQGFKDAGNEVTAIIGSRNKDLLILEKEMTEASTNLVVCTDDGSYGKHGFVTDALKEIIDSGKKVDLVVAIGPVPMMKFVAKVTEPYGIKTVVSLNPIMIDGTGMCGGCRVKVGGKTKFVCVDGPEFDGHQVDWDLLVQRQAAYKGPEKDSLDQFLETGEAK